MSQEKKEGDTETEAVLEGAMDGLSFPAGALIVRLADGIRVLLIESGFFFCPSENLCSRMPEMLHFCKSLTNHNASQDICNNKQA